jgi:hypothetical protein
MYMWPAAVHWLQRCQGPSQTAPHTCAPPWLLPDAGSNASSRSNTPVRVRARQLRAGSDAVSTGALSDSMQQELEGGERGVLRSNSFSVLPVLAQTPGSAAGSTSIRSRARRLSVTTYSNDGEDPAAAGADATSASQLNRDGVGSEGRTSLASRFSAYGALSHHGRASLTGVGRPPLLSGLEPIMSFREPSPSSPALDVQLRCATPAQPRPNSYHGVH